MMPELPGLRAARPSEMAVPPGAHRAPRGKREDVGWIVVTEKFAVQPLQLAHRR